MSKISNLSISDVFFKLQVHQRFLAARYGSLRCSPRALSRLWRAHGFPIPFLLDALGVSIIRPPVNKIPGYAYGRRRDCYVCVQINESFDSVKKQVERDVKRELTANNDSVSKHMDKVSLTHWPLIHCVLYLSLIFSVSASALISFFSFSFTEQLSLSASVSFIFSINFPLTSLFFPLYYNFLSSLR